jgi:hypothetical protein
MQSTDVSVSDLREAFKHARYARNISIRAAAAEIGISTHTLTAMNRGGHQTDLTRQRIRNWCNAQADALDDVTEVWRTVPGWEGYYEASSKGRVRSVERVVKHPNGSITVAPRILRPSPHESGHLRVCLSRDRHGSTHYVHTLVLEAFHGLKPFPSALCRHLNGVETDNRPENLRWGTYGENRLDTEWHAEHPGEVRAA